MAYNFLPCDRNQAYLLPPSLVDWLPEDHLAWFVLDAVEPVFGQIKDARGFDKFMRRGIEACQSEWSLICATHNLLKLWRSGKACWS